MIIGLDRLNANLRRRMAEARLASDASVVTGYRGVNYAVYVHEAVEGAPNPPKTEAQRRAMFASIRERERRGHRSWHRGKPKFLERPARELNNSGELGRVISGAVRAGVPLEQALLMAGMRIQRESQDVVPVDTGNLKGSAFTEVE